VKIDGWVIQRIMSPAWIQLIQEKINDDTGNRNIKPDRINKTSKLPVPVKITF